MVHVPRICCPLLPNEFGILVQTIGAEHVNEYNILLEPSEWQTRAEEVSMQARDLFLAKTVDGMVSMIHLKLAEWKPDAPAALEPDASLLPAGDQASMHCCAQS